MIYLHFGLWGKLEHQDKKLIELQAHCMEQTQTRFTTTGYFFCCFFFLQHLHILSASHMWVCRQPVQNNHHRQVSAGDLK